VAPEGCLPPALAPHLGDGPATPHADQPIEPTEVSIDNQMSRLHSALQVNIVIFSLSWSILFPGMFGWRCPFGLGEYGPARCFTDQLVEPTEVSIEQVDELVTQRPAGAVLLVHPFVA
jgi:hypothetical protein